MNKIQKSKDLYVDFINLYHPMNHNLGNVFLSKILDRKYGNTEMNRINTILRWFESNYGGDKYFLEVIFSNKFSNKRKVNICIFDIQGNMFAEYNVYKGKNDYVFEPYDEITKYTKEHLISLGIYDEKIHKIINFI